MSEKSKAKKKRLAVANRTANRVPEWVVAETDGDVLQVRDGRTVNPEGRHWRRDSTDE